MFYDVLKILAKPMYKYMQVQIFNLKWRRNNNHNSTNAVSVFPMDKVTVGSYTYGDLNIRSYRVSKEKLVIGSFCSIGPDVCFFLGGEHDYRNITTFPIKHNILKQDWEAVSKGPIIVEDDVWIGCNVIILSGVRIGQGAVIGAGSIVSCDIPPYSIFCNGEVKKLRFNKSICEKLCKIDYSKVLLQDIKDNLDLFYDVNKFIESDYFQNKFCLDDE